MAKTYVVSEILPYLPMTDSQKKVVEKSFKDKEFTVSDWYKELRKLYPSVIYTQLLAMEQSIDNPLANEFKDFTETKKRRK